MGVGGGAREEEVIKSDEEGERERRRKWHGGITMMPIYQEGKLKLAERVKM